jgi:hypothetical protein
MVGRVVNEGGSESVVVCKWTGVDKVDLVEGVDTASGYGNSTLSTESITSTAVHLRGYPR